FAQIGYYLDKYLQGSNPHLYAAVEYKRIDFLIAEKHTSTEDRILCIFEGKCYYTWDTAERHWNKKWFDHDPPKEFNECKDAILKLKKLENDKPTQNAEKYFVLFLEHFGNHVRKNYPYAKAHNDVLSDYGNDPTKLITQSQKFVETLFPKLGLKIIYYDVQEEISQYRGNSMGLITAIGEIVS
ncbi:MAG: hypothetical protein ACXADY_24025, partial [Candidatus Hodarchaeales archaeon]